MDEEPGTSSENNSVEEEETPKPGTSSEFKMPLSIGCSGALRKTLLKAAAPSEQSKQPKEQVTYAELIQNPQTSDNLFANNLCAIPYKEPNWSGLCPGDNGQYVIEVLKSGTIVETINLMNKPFIVFGRLSNCDVIMAHPSISRFHAVLQYKAFGGDGEQPCGWYLIDLGSTHGTFINRNPVRPNHYTKIKVGHHLVFGISSRRYILMGPSDDLEDESELKVNQMRQQSMDMQIESERQIQEAIEQTKKNELETEKKIEDQGINWGMGEDAEEEPDLADNPYASTTNEELYLTDPKKTLRGYFEREGDELTYDCEERGAGQFLCKVELPINDARGRPVVAEVLHKGKKKEAVVQCALEACRMLDRAGVLRQAKHESRRRKQRDYSADDYYSSDEDTFLDRTGAVEKKREMRRRKYNTQADEPEFKGPLTYQQLLKQMADTEKKIEVEEKSLQNLRDAGKPQGETSKEDGDSLDNYMSSLTNQGYSMAQKAEISNTKMTIKKLKAELSSIANLVDIVRPVDLPPLVKKNETITASLKKGNNSVVYGKRVLSKEPRKPIETKPVIETVTRPTEEFVEEIDSDDQDDLIIDEDVVNVYDNEDNSPGNNSIETCDKPTTTQDHKEGSNFAKNGYSEPRMKMYGPMRHPENYVIPESYYEQVTDRDLPEIIEED